MDQTSNGDDTARAECTGFVKSGCSCIIAMSKPCLSQTLLEENKYPLTSGLCVVGRIARH